MKKVFKLVDLDCANCAAKMERAIAQPVSYTHLQDSSMKSCDALRISEGVF